MKDFFEIMKSQGVYREANHNKSEHIYKYRGNEIEFISVDQEQKIRGRKRQYLWMNEANEFKYNDFRQLVMRTERQIFMDYNPSDEYHWIYDNVLTRNDAEKIHSTYLDNKHLNPEIIKEIERLRGMDQNYWRIYGLGLRGASEAKIYTHWQLCDALPENPDEIVYGLDFGFNNPTALVKIAAKDKNFYWQEKLYQSFLTNTQLIEKLGTFEIGNAIIYADSAEPARIAEIKRAGFNIKPAKKEVKERIDFIKSHEFHITKDSVNVQKEAKSYSWKLKDEKPTDEPVKDNDHLMDAGGYAIYTRFGHRIKTKLEWI